MATVGTPRAAARCMRPESLVTKKLQRVIRPMASPSDVRPQRLIGLCAMEVLTASQIVTSLPVPIKSTLAPHLSIAQSPIRANRSGGHRLAFPKIAPGLSPTSKSDWAIPFDSIRVLASSIYSWATYRDGSWGVASQPIAPRIDR